MGFIVILALTTLSIAVSAAFFSIFGLAQIYSGSFWPIVIMATSLEAGKLITASFIYRYRKTLHFLMTIYLSLAMIVLMIITSAGIFGFLSAAYQQDMLPIKLNEQKIELLGQEKKELEALKIERLERKKQIDNDIAALPNSFVTGRQRLLQTYETELTQLQTDISLYTTQIREKTITISQIKNKNLEEQTHVGPIIFIAKVFEREVDDATKWLTLLIIFAFDPLAIALTIGVNMALLQYKKEIEKEDDEVSVNDFFDDVVATEPTLNGDGESLSVEPNPKISDVNQLKEYPKKKPTENNETPAQPIGVGVPKISQTKAFKPHISG